MADVGTLAWARNSDGRLSIRDRLGQLAAALELQIRVLPAQLRWRFGLGEPGALVDITSIRVPDSVAAKRAEERCRELSPPFLVNHCLRTYLWAQALAVPCRLRADAELLYIASLLHDLGLTEKHQQSRSRTHCFAVRGAAAAASLVAELGWTLPRQNALAEMITLHLNVAVGVEYGVEALLLNAATALDVTGLRIWELHGDTVRAVVDRHPRLGMKAEMLAAWRHEAGAHPGSRAHFLSTYLGFESRTRRAPFAE